MPTIERKTQSGEAMQLGEYQVTPQSQVLSIRFPGRNIGLIWNRPKAVLVRTPDGQETSLPVRDVTRLMIWSMLAGGLAGMFMMAIMRRK